MKKIMRVSIAVVGLFLVTVIVLRYAEQESQRLMEKAKESAIECEVKVGKFKVIDEFNRSCDESLRLLVVRSLHTTGSDDLEVLRKRFGDLGSVLRWNYSIKVEYFKFLESELNITYDFISLGNGSNMEGLNDLLAERGRSIDLLIMDSSPIDGDIGTIITDRLVKIQNIIACFAYFENEIDKKYFDL
ncbi:hypothetical protein ACFL08_05260 [Patescibacteria group bacterium]